MCDVMSSNSALSVRSRALFSRGSRVGVLWGRRAVISDRPVLSGAMPPKAAPKGQNIPSWWAPVVWELWAEKKSAMRSCYDNEFYTAAP